MTEIATLPLADLASFDFRAEGRDAIADAVVVHARVAELLAAVPDGAWDRPLTNSAVPGAPMWTLRDHIGHVIDSDEDATRVAAAVIDRSGDWPTREVYAAFTDEAGEIDWDRWNESRRPPYADLSPAVLRDRYDVATAALIEVVRRFPPDVAATPQAWGWTWPLLLDHAAEHAAHAEPLAR